MRLLLGFKGAGNRGIPVLEGSAVTVAIWLLRWSKKLKCRLPRRPCGLLEETNLSPQLRINLSSRVNYGTPLSSRGSVATVAICLLYLLAQTQSFAVDQCVVIRMSSIRKSKTVRVGRDWKHCKHHQARILICFQSAITPSIIRNKQALLPKLLSSAD